MINKIDIRPIMKDHFNTLKDSRGTRILKRDVLGFYILPMLIALGLVIIDVIIPDKYISIGLIGHTIFIPLLINVLFLIYNILERSESAMKEEKSTLKQLYQNLAYTILMSFFSLILLSVFSVNCWNVYIQKILHFFFYFLFFHLFLTSLMIIKRCHVLLSSDLEA